MKNLAVALLIGLVIFPCTAGAANFGTALGIMGTNTAPDALSASRGNTWAADPEGSSNNPACIAAGEAFKVSGAGHYSATFFKSGPTVHTYYTSLYATMPFGGVAQVTYGDSRSGSAATRMDGESVRFDYQPYVEVMYGRKVKENLLRDGDKLYLGAGAEMNWSKMGFASQGQTNFISRSRGMTLRFGALYQPNDVLNFGASYSWSRDWCEDRDKDNFTSSRYTSDVHRVRIGASWTVLPEFGTTVSADLQHLNIGHVKRDQYFIGVSQQVVKDRLYAYGGWANSGPTAGLGLYFKNGGVNVAYQNNPYADLNPHLGRAQTISATVFFRW